MAQWQILSIKTSRTWKHDLIRRLYQPHTCKEILQLPLSEPLAWKTNSYGDTQIQENTKLTKLTQCFKKSTTLQCCKKEETMDYPNQYGN